MSIHVSRPPFDQNDPKYFCCCGSLHIKKGARIIAVLTNVFTAANIIFSFTRNSTVAFYSLMSAAFSVVVFGSMLYGVFKEKRLYLVPYLLFQALSIALTLLCLFIFLISLAAQSNIVLSLARDLGNVDTTISQKELDAQLAAFTVVFTIGLCIGVIVQAFFGEVIYSFHNFLRDREQSFNFNFDTSTFQTTPPPSAGPIPISDEEKQLLAAEFKISETAFPEPKNGDFKTAYRFDLRWFTPAVEIDLCGHGTLATAHAIFNELENENSELIFETADHGDLIVSRGPKGLLAMNFPQYQLVSVKVDGKENVYARYFPEIPAPSFLQPLVKLLIPRDLKIDGIVHTQAGKKLIVILDKSTTKEQFASIVGDSKKTLQLVPTADWLHGIIVTLSPTHESQGFLNSEGEKYDYDPATGSAQCGLGPLWRTVLGKEELKGFQAYPKRGAEFQLSFPSEGRVLIQGSAVTVVKGTLYL